jgi:hypothetical protein
MNIKDIIYFSPNHRMSSLNFENKEQMIDAFEDRITRYYLNPIKMLNDIKSAFSAGVIILSLVDAFARYSSKEDQSGKRIPLWLQKNIKTISNMPNKKRDLVSESIYKDFRCGLLHESHIKNGGQFSYEIGSSAFVHNKYIIINPKAFHKELTTYFQSYIDQLRICDELYDIFIERIKKDFEKECKEFSDREAFSKGDAVNN